nr:sigma-70 family RNA polymerase sigma factor [Sphingobacterium multivorum]
MINPKIKKENHIQYFSDKELLSQLRNGDKVAFSSIYDKYAAILAAKLHKLIKIHTIVEELHQEAFLRLWKIRNELDENTNIKAYLFTTCRNLTIDFYRKASKDKELERQLIKHLDVSYDPIGQLLSQKESKALAESLIGLLPPQRQKVFRMVKLDGYSYEETSIHFGVSTSTIKDHMAKSSEFLKNYIAQNPHITFAIAVYIVFK